LSLPHASSSNDATFDFQEALEAARHGTIEDRSALLDSFRDDLTRIAADIVNDESPGLHSTDNLVESAVRAAHTDFDQCRANNAEEFKAWLRQLLVNEIVHRYRALCSHTDSGTNNERFDGQRAPVDRNDSSVEEKQLDEEKRRLRKAMSGLSTDERRLIEMRHRDGLSFAQIAAEVNCSSAECRQSWRQAVDSLASILQDEREQT